MRSKLCVLLLLCPVSVVHGDDPNSLTPAEKQAGFVSLFNGRDLQGWRPERGPWTVKDGAIHLPAAQFGIGCSLEYGDALVPGDFELCFQWKESQPVSPWPPGQFTLSTLGVATPNGWAGGISSGYYTADRRIQVFTTGGVFTPFTIANGGGSSELPGKDLRRPAGEWNDARMVYQGTLVQHWVNDECMFEWDFGSPFFATLGKEKWNVLVAQWLTARARGMRLELECSGTAASYRAFKMRSLGKKLALKARSTDRVAMHIRSVENVSGIEKPGDVSVAVPSSDRPVPASAIAPFKPEQALEYQEAWADHLGQPIEWTNSVGMRFRLIPPGEFTMGHAMSGQQASEAPRGHKRIAEPFYFGVHEITRDAWEAVMGTRPWSCEWNAKEDGDCPVTYVTWEQATRFCQALSAKEGRQYQLPTEIQWEYACRAGTTTAYYFGDDEAQLEQYAWWGKPLSVMAFVEGDSPFCVGLKQPNPFGLYDMHGNVEEWCADRDYDKDYWLGNDPKGPEPNHVIRGGDWHANAWCCQSAVRQRDAPGGRRSNSVGFRVVLIPLAN